MLQKFVNPFTVSRAFLPFGTIWRLALRGPRRPTRRSRRSDRPPAVEALETRVVPTGTWSRLANLAPDTGGTMMLLSDGTVIMHDANDDTGTSANRDRWYKLTPTASGDYVNGTWSSIKSMSLQRLFFGSNVLTDGSIFVVGGEYSGAAGTQNWTNTGEIYNPVADTWSNIPNFPQTRFGDDPTIVLPNGQVLAGYLSGPQTYIYNGLGWSATGNKQNNDNSDEETWIKLPDNSILSYDVCTNDPTGCSRGHAQRYIPSSGTWVATGTAPNNLTNSTVGYELGPAFRLPDGRALFLGATNHTAFYNPGTDSWTSGLDIPGGRGADDAPGAVLPNGKILFAADTPKFVAPTHLYEYDPVANTYTDVTPSLSGFTTNTAAYHFRMLVLPTGQVLVANQFNQVIVYAPDGSPQNVWRPTISKIISDGGTTYTLTGTQLNGISEGASYGDDAEMSSNYPIVQLSDNAGHVYYARTFNWSSTGIATGATPVTTQFTLPAQVTGGIWTVKVIANGIASAGLPYNFTATGTWTRLNNVAPDAIGTMLLLSDGTVLAQDAGTCANLNKWYKLTPTTSGNYVGGTWSNVASMSLQRLYYGSNMLPDGRVLVEGGEYTGAGCTQNFTNTGEIYNPLSNTWTAIANFPQSQFGDDPTAVLPNGTVLAGYINGAQTYIYNPATNTWSATGTKLHNDTSSKEETWVKLPDGSVLSYDIYATLATGVGHAQRYVPASGTWVDAGTPPNNLTSLAVDDEIGPALRVPDGRILFLGATGHTAFYNPASNTWAAGPDMPAGLGADDAPAAVLPNGHVLFAADTPLFNGPTHILEYDPVANTYADVTPDVINTSNTAFFSRMLVLPTGQVLLTTSTNQLALWTPNGGPQDAWRPTVTRIDASGGGTFTLTGTQLNGLSEGAAYGDDAEMSSNYPIVELNDLQGHYYFARTFNWSSTGVATGSTPVTTQFTLPAIPTTGPWLVWVIANGISSTGLLYDFSTPTHLGLSTFFNSTTAGRTFNLTVQALGAAGDQAYSYRGTVHFTSNDSQAILPADYTFTAADNGAHTFTVTLKTAGSRTITATDTATASITGTRTLTVNPAAASMLLVNGPAFVTAGAAANYTVTAVDPYRNRATSYRGTVHFTSSDPQAGLPPNYTFTAADNGVHTVSVTWKTATPSGSQSIAATDTVNSSIRGGQAGILVSPAAASTLLVAGFPSPVVAGVAGMVTVTAKDLYGNTATGYRGTVRFTSSDLQAVLPANYTFTSADNGIHTFTATLRTAGTRSLTVTDTVTGSIMGTQSGILVTPAAASTLLVTGFPSPVLAGTAGSVTVTAKDPFGNTATGYRGTVHFSSSDPRASLPANYTFTAADNGAHVFTATLCMAGTQSITAADFTVNPPLTGTQSGITVNPGPVSTFMVTGFPSPVVAGTPGTVTVTAKDACGNVATSYRGTVHFTSSDSRASLPADYTFTTADNGMHVFAVVLTTAGTQTITATATVTGSLTGTQGGIVVNPAAASTLVVTGFPSPVVAGTAGTFTVTAFDAFGNVATSYGGTVTFTSSDPQAGLPADAPLTNGSGTFTALLATVGSQSLTATDTLNGSLSGTESGIMVTPAAASQFVVTTSAANPEVAGTAFDVTVTATDPYSNTDTNYQGTVHFSSADPFGATLPADYMFQPTDAGRVTFAGGATLYTAGTWDVTATDTASGITGSASVTVLAAPAVAFQVLAPASAASGVAFDVTVIAVDPYGNTDMNYTGTVHFTTSDMDPGVVLPADYTFQPTDAGMVTFGSGVTLITPGDQSLTVTDTVSGITGSTTVTVTGPGTGSPAGQGHGTRARPTLPARSAGVETGWVEAMRLAALDQVFGAMASRPGHRLLGDDLMLDLLG
jgi:hypothetical protein